MPLDSDALQDDIKDALDSTAPTATKAAAWGTAVGAYADGVTPALASGAAAAAGTALGAVLVTAFANPVGAAGAAAAEAGFVAFGTAVAGAMAPAFVGVPPVAAVGLADIFASHLDDPPVTTTEASAQLVADAVQSWMEAGTATPSGGGPPVNWS